VLPDALVPLLNTTAPLAPVAPALDVYNDKDPPIVSPNPETIATWPLVVKPAPPDNDKELDCPDKPEPTEIYTLPDLPEDEVPTPMKIEPVSPPVEPPELITIDPVN
jgi:hypothetical protein